jgi:hypothetical protein
MLGSVAVYAGLVSLLVGLATVVRPLGILGLTSRRMRPASAGTTRLARELATRCFFAGVAVRRAACDSDCGAA